MFSWRKLYMRIATKKSLNYIVSTWFIMDSNTGLKIFITIFNSIIFSSDIPCEDNPVCIYYISSKVFTLTFMNVILFSH